MTESQSRRWLPAPLPYPALLLCSALLCSALFSLFFCVKNHTQSSMHTYTVQYSIFRTVYLLYIVCILFICCHFFYLQPSSSTEEVCLVHTNNTHTSSLPENFFLFAQIEAPPILTTLQDFLFHRSLSFVLLVCNQRKQSLS